MSKVSVSREQFRQAFRSAWDKVYVGDDRRQELEYIYRESEEEWTDVMCGKEPPGLDGMSLIARTLEELNKHRLGGTLEFDPERQDMDAYGRVIRQPHRYHTDGINIVAIEVENATRKSYEEFWKLVHLRCTLKVLITYRAPRHSQRPDALDKAMVQMQDIYRHANDVLGPDRPDSYLLVVGTRASKAAMEILWEFYGLDAEGRFSEKIG